MKKTLLVAALMACTFCAVAQVGSPDENLQISILEGPKPWSSLDLNNDARNFQFAIVTDRTGGHRPGVFLDGVQKLNLLQPEFVLSVGDLIEGYTEDLVELNRQWDEFDGFIDSLQVPFFYVPGNHDITNKVMEDLWKKRLGPTYYYFIYHDVLFLCLNSEDQYRGAGNGSISDEQYEWIRQVLSEHSDVRWTLVFMHQPLWLQDTDPVRWFDVEKLLADRDHTVFVGHRHHYVKYRRNNNNNYYLLATTGGGSSLRGPQLGEFDHVVWATMTDEGPIMANLQLEGIWSDDVVNEDVQAAIEKITGSTPIRIEPLYYDGKPTAGGKVKIRLTNDEDIPMEVHLKNGFSWSYNSSLAAEKIEVAPNSVEIAEMSLEPRSKKVSDHIDPVEIQAKVKYLDGKLAEVAVPFTYKVAPEKKLYLDELKNGAKIDGNLEEWDRIPNAYTIKTHLPAEDNGGPMGARTVVPAEDIAGQFKVAIADDQLYIAVKIQDDDLQLDTTEVAWRQDYIGVVIDGAPTPISAMRTGRGWYRESLLYTITPSTRVLPSSTFYDDRLPEGTQWICRSAEGGYVLEAGIPLDLIREQQGENWRSVRINVSVQDRDAGEAEFPRYSFMPGWRGSDNRIGSGMFFRRGVK